MSNLKGAILATAIFVAVAFPFLLMISVDTFQQHAFLKVTEEVTELVKEEGGVSEQVAQVTDRLTRKGYSISFSKPGLVKFGEEIVIGYKYEYQNVRGKKKLDVQDKVIIMKRSTGKDGSGNNGTPNPTEIAKFYSTKTPESLQPDKEYTFTVPGLTNLKSVTANMGNVEVVRVDGDKVTVKVSGGNVIKTVQTGGSNSPADEKYVTGEDLQDYNKDGYTGKLEKYLYSGSLLSADSKEITDIKTSLFSTNFPGSIVYAMNGYSGILMKNGSPSRRAIAGEYSPADTKWVEDADVANYNQNGYTGTLEQYLVSGKYTPSDTKYVSGQSSDFYDKDGYKGYLRDREDVYQMISATLSGGYGDPTGDPRPNCPSPKYNFPEYGELEFVTAFRDPLSSMEWTCVYEKKVYMGIVYSGYVTKPEEDTRVYAYKGFVTRPIIDTRIYEYVQNYTGTVTRPEMDTRIYKYRGKVIRPSSDSRTYENYYQYELSFEYR